MAFYIISHNDWFQYLMILAILMILVLLFKRRDLSSYYEGFSQDVNYVYKTGDDIYDDFYVEIYDKLMETDNHCSYQIEKLIENTNPSKKNSVFLDIGSRTGVLASKICEKGYTTYALDKSQSMVEYSEKKCADLNVKCGDVRDPLLYDQHSFSHILNTGLGIYQFENKDMFFRNSYFWLRPGGYLIIHLADRDKFDTIIPGGKPPLIDNPQQYSIKRITDTIIDFIDFTYKGSYDFTNINTNKVIFKETFTDGLTGNVRQNEKTLYMENINEIVQLALDAGYILHNKTNLKECLGDEHQFMYIFKRPN
jgi:SAM-dependent methyltransferase